MATVIRKINELAHDLGNSRPTLEKARNRYFRFVETVFASEGAKGTGKWKDLSASRIAQRGDYGHPILDYTGELWRSVAIPGGYSGTNITGWQDIQPDQATFIAQGWKVGPHPGSTGGSGSQSGREFWPWRTSEEDLVFKEFEIWADQWLRRP